MDLYKFETLIVDLFAKMGYGKLQYESHVTRKPGDDGIDGIVTADKLGFDSIYIQAKSYNDTSVGRLDIQKFVGALAVQGATKRNIHHKINIYERGNCICRKKFKL